jgi:hypothetical protein
VRRKPLDLTRVVQSQAIGSQKIKDLFMRNGAVSLGSCFLLALSTYPTQAAPSKAEIDNYARANGFPNSDYPYYDKVNGCGGEGWSNTAVRDRWGKVSFSDACANHDRCYMRLGSDVNACEDNFYKDLRASCEKYSYYRDPIFKKKIPDPATLSACYPIATTYYGGVRAVGWKAHQKSQEQAKKYNNTVQSGLLCINNNINISPQNSNLEFPRGTEWVTCSRYKFVFQNDSNLVLYNPSGQAIWSTGTNTASPDKFVVQTDGNIVLYRQYTPVWATATNNSNGVVFAIQWDGNVVVYDRSGRPLWATNTVAR